MRPWLIAIFLLPIPAYGLEPGGVVDAVQASRVTGGIVVHLHCGDGRETGELRLGESYLVHGLDTDATQVDSAKAYLRSKGAYGPISVARFDGRHLPYRDNLVNLLVADSLREVSPEEALRVLAPGGKMIVAGQTTVKPWPDNIDDWPQYLNKADNNAVALDSVVGPPRHLQWTGEPRWSRSHMTIPTVVSVVTSNGRLFSIEDRAPSENPFLPGDFHLVARDAFNGTVLWDRAIDQWEAITIYIKCLPVQQQRRMVVVDDVLYCTLSLHGPLSALDAATGETLKTYESISPVQEIAYADGLLYLNVGERFNASAYNLEGSKNPKKFEMGLDPTQPFRGSGFREGYAPETPDRRTPVSHIIAVDPESGREAWSVRNIQNYTGGSLAIQSDFAVYQSQEGLFCVHSKTGEALWTVKKSIGNAVGSNSLTPGTMPNTLIIADGMVLAVETTTVMGKRASRLHAYALNDGTELWTSGIFVNYQASADVFFVNGELWINGANPTQLDPETGQQIRKIEQQMTGPMGHDRCYRNLITERFFINSRTGGADFLDRESGQEFPNHWTRGGCGMGVLPANGLLYTTPYACSCSMGPMFPGMNAYASAPELEVSNQTIEVPRETRLEQGPAYQQKESQSRMHANDWPQYRHNGFRGGITAASLSPDLEVAWNRCLKGTPSAITSAFGQVFVTEVDNHTLLALDANNGDTRWAFTADARIDSPPTCYRGMVYFGSRGGWVYCLRASDGTLAWRFKDLPDQLIGARRQLESAWPICGSVLLLDDTLFFAAGRSSFLDGGIVLYALAPATGELLRRRSVYGPFNPDTGFPAVDDAGFINDVLSTDGTKLYLRQRAFDKRLADATADGHIITSGGFLDGQVHHRTDWSLGTILNNRYYPRQSGDILASDGREYYCVTGFPLDGNHSYFDPRKRGYALIAKQVADNAAPVEDSQPQREGTGRWSSRPARITTDHTLWAVNIPISGKAIAVAGDVLFVAGEPMQFEKPTSENYIQAYDGLLGGKLLAISRMDGCILASYDLPAAPSWDSIAIAGQSLYIALENGQIICMTPQKEIAP